MKRTRKVLAFLVTSFAVVALTAATPPALRVGAPIPATVSGTAVAAPAAMPMPSTTQSVSHTALTAEELDATVGDGWGWLTEFLEGVKEGAITAMIFIALLAVYG